MADQESRRGVDPQQLDQRAGAGQADDIGILEDKPDTRSELDFPVVGVGASAGGLEAFEALLRHLPSDTGTAVIFVQHLSPEHASNLTEILPRATKMPVHEATDGRRPGEQGRRGSDAGGRCSMLGGSNKKVIARTWCC